MTLKIDIQCMYMYIDTATLFLEHFDFLILDRGKDVIFRKLLYLKVTVQCFSQQSLTKLKKTPGHT